VALYLGLFEMFVIEATLFFCLKSDFLINFFIFKLISKINFNRQNKKQPNNAKPNRLVKTLRFSNMKHVVALFNLHALGILFIFFNSVCLSSSSSSITSGYTQPNASTVYITTGGIARQFTSMYCNSEHSTRNRERKSFIK